jgi:hypothetical protein
MAITKVTRSVIDDSVFQGTLSSEGFPIINTNTYVGGFKNKLHNGDMRIDQRNGGRAFLAGFGVENGFLNVVDRWRVAIADSPNMLLSAQQVDDVPTGSGFAKSTRLEIAQTTTAAASTVAVFIQYIEGQNITDFSFGTPNAKPLTLSFWVKSSVTGTHSGSFRAVNGNLVFNVSSNVFTYTIAAPNTWEYKTITVPGNTTFTPHSGSDVGFSIAFNLGCGANWLATPNTWVNQRAFGTPGAVQLAKNNVGATFFITGIQLEIGNKATTFEHRPFGTELSLCQRYYYTTYYPDFSVGTNVLSAWTGTGGRALEALYAGYTNGHEVDGIRTSSVNGITTSYETYWLWPQEMRRRPNVTIYSMDGRPGKCSIWFQCWTPTLSYVVFDAVGRGNTNGYSFVPVQNVTTFINNNPTVVRTTIGGATLIGVLSGFDRNNTLQSWTPYTVDGVNLGWPTGYLGMTDKERLLIQSTPHFLWHVVATADF